MCHCNNAHLSGEGGTGDPTELALRISGAKAELVVDGVHRLVEIPFDSSAKYMAVLVDDGNRRQVMVTGAPERVIEMCASQLTETGDVVGLDKDAALATARSFARDALRTLAFAIKTAPADSTGLQQDQLDDLCFVGLQGMIDPPRESAVQAVSQCRQAGIRTVMITGDHPDTAQAVATQLGIDSHRVLTGVELSDLDEAGYHDAVAEVSVFARVAPEHKKITCCSRDRNLSPCC